MRSQTVAYNKHKKPKEVILKQTVIELTEENMKRLYDISSGINRSISDFFSKGDTYNRLNGNQYRYLHVSNTPQKKMMLILSGSKELEGSNQDHYLSTHKNSKSVAKKIINEYSM